MEKVESREKHLNNDLKKYITQYKSLSIDLSQINGLIKDIEVEKLDKEQELLDLLNEVETIKSQMEHRGNAMTDGSMFCIYKYKKELIDKNIIKIVSGPIINIKKSIVRIKEDISEMDLQIGVLDHIINTDLVKQNIQKIEIDPLGAML